MVRIHRHLANPARWNALVVKYQHAHERIAAGAFANLPIPAIPEARERVKPFYANRDGIAIIDARGSEEGYIAGGPIMSVLAEELEVSANTLRSTTKVQGGRMIGPFRLVRVPSEMAWTLESMLDSAHQRVVIATVRKLWHGKWNF
ncbi:hypothetical protein BCR44DRAFT_35714 [Catenaria anguillulae PL171]|uniref:Uncharacterized protein n=1 Tax=Catenaria anguillulae PL171 TaxID=765915 RepID=A0A1Y2H4F1_9FUNG|nr:hypothetical protein BCR44DRAFT_35714 [Catenaria anguillulae PL171]